MKQPGIKKFKLSQIKAAKYNPRVISTEALDGLTNSIKRFGCVEPIVVNIKGGANTIIGGAPELAKSPDGMTARHRKGHPNNLPFKTTTLGWKATCNCGIEETVPALVLDPFMGSGTVGMVSAKLGRNYMGIEINPDYIENQAKYRLAEGETGIPKQELISGQGALFE